MNYSYIMNERLTSLTPSETHSAWAKLVFPFMLLLSSIAMIALDMDSDVYVFELAFVDLPPLQPFPMNTLIFMMLVTLSGVLVRNLIPLKSSPGFKAFSSASGVGIPFIFLQGYLPFIDNPIMNFMGASLLVSSWIFQLYGKDKALHWSIASGLTAGLACSTAPVCFSGVIPLMIFSMCYNTMGWKYKTGHLGMWIASFLCGLVPTLYLADPFAAYSAGQFDWEIIRSGYQFIIENSPIWSWFFIAVGMLVAAIQKNPIILGLILPVLALRLIFAGLMPPEFWGPDSTLLLPFAWLTAYGMIRVLKGIEQGVRNVSNQQAKWIPTIGTGVFVLGFTLKMLSLFYLVD